MDDVDPLRPSMATGPAVPPRHAARKRRRWRPNVLLILVAILALGGITTLTYSSAASWTSAVNQSQIVDRYSVSVNKAIPSPIVQLKRAEAYNAALSSGAILSVNANVPKGNGTTANPALNYDDMLRTDTGVMARIQIPKIDVDLPIYHGTSDQTLLQGVGHLEGTSLPVGGPSTHAVLTGHRGLPEATLFTNLDQLVVGDTFTITTFGRVLTYRIVDKRVVEPSESDSLRQQEGRDLVTLVTCTPLGINTHRILVTGERVNPTPDAARVLAKKPPISVQFPWWLVWWVIGVVLIGLYVWRGGLPAKPRRKTASAPPLAVSPSAEAEVATIPSLPVFSGLVAPRGRVDGGRPKAPSEATS